MDRVLLNPWVSRAGNAAFLVSVGLFIARYFSGWDPLSLIALILLAIGVVLMAAPYVGRLRERRSTDMNVLIRRGAKEAKKEKRPRLRAGEFTEEIRQAKGGRDLQVLRVGIYNAEDSGGDEATAFDVVPKVEAFDPLGNLVTSTKGVWGPDVNGRQPSAVTFRPTHEEHPLELVAKFPDASDAWLAGRVAPNLRPGRYKLRASLRGENLDEPAVFEWHVQNDGKGRRLVITNIGEYAPAPVARVESAATSASVVSSGAALVTEKDEAPFPRSEIEIGEAGYFENDAGRRFITFRVRVTNREPTQRMNLQLVFVLRMMFKGVSRKMDVTLHAQDHPNTLPHPVNVEPQTTEKGWFTSEWYLETGVEFQKEGYRVEPSGEGAGFLARVTEYVTGQTIEIPVPGTWSRA